MGKNNFGLKLTNTTSSKQTLKLFELGATGNDVPIQIQSSTNQITDTNLLYAVTGAWDYTGTIEGSDQFVTLNNSLLETTVTGMSALAILTFSNGTVVEIQPDIAVGDTLTQILTIMSDGIAEKVNVDSNMVSVTAQTLYQETTDTLRILFTVNYKYPNVSLTLYDLQYDNSLGTIDYFFPTSASDFSIDGSWEVGATTTPNGIEVLSQSNTSYWEILQSQNGSVIEIDHLDINTYGGVSDSVRQSQLLNCLKFNKKNANGDDFTYFRCPTIDAYQYQNTLRYVGLNRQSDVYTLDGTTQFQYGIEANATVSLDFSYTNLPNLIFGDKYKIAEKQKEIKNKKTLVEEHNKYAQEIILDVK